MNFGQRLDNKITLASKICYIVFKRGCKKPLLNDKPHIKRDKEG